MLARTERQKRYEEMKRLEHERLMREEEEEGDYDSYDSDDISDRSSSDGSSFIAQHIYERNTERERANHSEDNDMENDDDPDPEQIVNNHNCLGIDQINKLLHAPKPTLHTNTANVPVASSEHIEVIRTLFEF